ncbi:MAG: hypothetical protein EP329_11260 [Deltaproteobacteria bacterium]|nr:MAG: hypothetical protein EP329_11260 [Deltaproteobacteria bacterium]
MHRASRARAAVLALTLLAACPGPEPERALGDFGPMAEGIYGDALGDPLPYATAEQRATFERGHAVALRRFARRDGLGPAFNVTFCAACHERPVTGGSSGLYRNFFLSGVETADGAFIPGFSAGDAGGVIRLYYYGDDYPARPPVPAETNVVTQRNAIPFFGVGLVAELDGAEIERRADPDDADGDGISGRVNYDRGFVGRFGRKAQTVSIEGFIRGPLFNHLGVTTDPLSEDQRAALPVDSSTPLVRGALLEHGRLLSRFAQAAAPDGPTLDDDGVADPELSTAELFDLVSFAMLLAPPRPEPRTALSQRGAEVFDQLDCDACHTPRVDGPRGPLPLFSDLLVHDMGPALADGIRMKDADGAEFRTQPLWGIAAVGPYLHDGRALTLAEAIAMHGGEAQPHADAFQALSADDAAALEDFLVSLGGRAQATPGLLPPGAPIPAVGAYGGPRRALTPAEEARFLAGRALFDADQGPEDGVGAPRMNGDSCRACHFDPVIGGSGPRGVNVVRHGILNADGRFVAPAVGTILHRETILRGDANRPQAEANIFELRQTPALFGLGLIDEIDEDAILANADPDDTRPPDGISGRVSWTDGGRIGRFGWKAQVPTVDEFTRDAVGAELGMTLPAVAGMTFGVLHDNDDVPDPELSAEDAQLISDYVRLLAPPPRQPASDPDAAARGEEVFAEVGCASCHVPTLPTVGGEDVALFSDLLLHEILPADAVGIEDTSANMRELRTAPLWGIAKTAPYLHDGSADTLEDAIAGHDGEAAAVRDAFDALPTADRAALLLFLGTL